MESLGRYAFALCFFFTASFTASFAAFREALSFGLQTVAMPHPLRPETDRQKPMVL